MDNGLEQQRSFAKCFDTMSQAKANLQFMIIQMTGHSRPPSGIDSTGLDRFFRDFRKIHDHVIGKCGNSDSPKGAAKGSQLQG